MKPSFCKIKTGDYRRVMKTACYKTIASYDDLKTAKNACSSDSNCVAIQDDFCDSKPLQDSAITRIYTFRLCRKTFHISEKHHCGMEFGWGCNCAYKKQDSYGSA